jgi:hypothetical protein
LLIAENYNVTGDSYCEIGSAVTVEIRHYRKQGVRGGSKPPLRLESPVAVAEKHRNVIGEPVRSYNIRHAIAGNNARLMPAPGT